MRKTDKNLGSAICLLRTMKKIKPKSLAYQAQLSLPQLSRIEEGLAIPSTAQIERIFQLMNVSFNDSYSWTVCYKNKIDNLYRKYLNFEFKDTQEMIEELMEKEEEIMASSLAMDYFLLKLMYSVLFLNEKEKKQIEKTLELLKTVEKSMEDYQSAIFHLYSGIHSLRNEAYLAEADFLKALKCKERFYQGLAHYLLSYYYEQTKQLFKSHEHCLAAESIFKELNNDTLLAYCTIRKAALYCECGLFDEAAALLKSKLEHPQYIHLEYEYNLVFHLCWCLLEKGDYEEANRCLKQYHLEEIRQERFELIKALIYLKTEQKAALEEMLSEQKEYHNKLIKEEMEIIFCLLKKDKAAEKKLLRLYHQYKNKGTRRIKRFVIQQCIDYYREEKPSYKNQAVYQNELLNLMKEG